MMSLELSGLRFWLMLKIERLAGWTVAALWLGHLWLARGGIGKRTCREKNCEPRSSLTHRVVNLNEDIVLCG